MAGSAVVFRWRPQPVSFGVAVRQVYGWLFDASGRVLVQDVGDGFNLPGGSPEVVDSDHAGTLGREALEESQVVVGEVVYLGYEEVPDGVSGRSALVRMAGRIEGFLPRHPDPDGGRLFGRLMTSLPEAVDLLGWGSSGTAQAEAAGAAASARWGLPVWNPSAAPARVD